HLAPGGRGVADRRPRRDLAPAAADREGGGLRLGLVAGPGLVSRAHRLLAGVDALLILRRLLAELLVGRVRVPLVALAWPLLVAHVRSLPTRLGEDHVARREAHENRPVVVAGVGAGVLTEHLGVGGDGADVMNAAVVVEE